MKTIKIFANMERRDDWCKKEVVHLISADLFSFFFLGDLLKCYLSSCAGVSEVSTAFQFIKLY